MREQIKLIGGNDFIRIEETTNKWLNDMQGRLVSLEMSQDTNNHYLVTIVYVENIK